MCPVRRWRVCSRWRGAACAGVPGTRYRPLSGPPDDLPHRVGGERRLALADEHVSCIRIVPLQAAEGSQLRSTQRVNRRDAVLEPGDMQEPLAEISLIPAQTDEFGHAQAVTVGR